MVPLTLHLVDRDPAVVEALRNAFSGWPDVTVATGDILELASDAVVSPANSYGYMDGGLDRRLVEVCGDQLQRSVLQQFDVIGDGTLAVGRAVTVATRHGRIPWLIVAPTMAHPDGATAASVYFAMSAVLLEAERHPGIARVYCPGLGTGVGQLDPATAGFEMARAYARWIERSLSA